MPLSWDPQAFSQEVVPGVSQAVQGIASVLMADREAARDERLRRRAESRRDAEVAAATLEKRQDIERAERIRKENEAFQLARTRQELDARKMQSAEDAARDFKHKQELEQIRSQLEIDAADRKRAAEAAHWREVNAALGRLDPQGQPLPFDPRIADQSALADARAEAARAQAALAGTRAGGMQKPPKPLDSTQAKQINDDLHLRALKAGALRIDPISKQPVVADQAAYDQMRDSAFIRAGVHPDNLRPLGPENPYQARNWTNDAPKGGAAPQAPAQPIAPEAVAPVSDLERRVSMSALQEWAARGDIRGDTTAKMLDALDKARPDIPQHERDVMKLALMTALRENVYGSPEQMAAHRRSKIQEFVAALNDDEGLGESPAFADTQRDAAYSTGRIRP